ncbi:MAG: DUF3618 domain-containing protein, partial [Pseudomonadota bacterium]|nr:DUF3618 domain-containing protein [Pseudomonadota bacterium]
MNDKVTPRDYSNIAAYAEDRSPDEIERDIEQTRAEMDYTLTALEHKLSPSQFMDQAMSYLRGGSGEANEFATNLGRTIKNNPLPVTLLGIGLAWLMMAGPEPRRERRYYATPSPEAGRYPPSSRVVTPGAYYGTEEPYSVGGPGVVAASGQPATTTSTSSASSKLKETVDRLKAGAGDAQSRVSGAAHATGERISQTAHDVSEGASRTAHDVGERVSDAAYAAGQRVSQTAHDVRERAGQMAHGASERMSHAAHEARLRMEHTAEAARHQAQRLGAAAQYQA